MNSDDEKSGLAPDNEINSLIDALARREFSAVIAKSTALAYKYPKDYLAHHVLGAALAGNGEHQKAIEYLRKAVRLNHEALESLNALGMSLRAERQYYEAAAVFSKAIEMAPNAAVLRNNYGNTLKDLNRYDDAINEFRRAIADNPRFPVAYKNLGAALTEIGETEDAIYAYEKAVELAPAYADAHYGLAMLKNFSDGDVQLSLLQQLQEKADLPNIDRANIAFALAKANDDVGKNETAFQLYTDANAYRRADIIYDIKKDRQQFTQIHKAFADMDQPKNASDTLSQPRPVFIVGMPRSGTTLAEQILASHTDIYGAGELTALNESIIKTSWKSEGITPAVINNVRAQYQEAITRLNIGAPVVTDKMPLNFLWIGFIILALPEAKIIHVRRDPRATCWSIFKQNFGGDGNGFAFDLRDVVDFYLLYSEYMTFWAEKFPGRIYDLDYDRLTKDPECEMRDLVAAAGLGWQDSCSKFYESKRAVSTASAAQVRKTVYSGSSDEWRRYEKLLAPYFNELPGR
ncbi:MAG: tetratricopeptide repeat protein [Marinicaulis sp.]|nr:tetratricopeptide repeat protein [Marinicaulis sp.]